MTVITNKTNTQRIEVTVSAARDEPLKIMDILQFAKALEAERHLPSTLMVKVSDRSLAVVFERRLDDD